MQGTDLSRNVRTDGSCAARQRTDFVPQMPLTKLWNYTIWVVTAVLLPPSSEAAPGQARGRSGGRCNLPPRNAYRGLQRRAYAERWRWQDPRQDCGAAKGPVPVPSGKLNTVGQQMGNTTIKSSQR